MRTLLLVTFLAPLVSCLQTGDPIAYHLDEYHPQTGLDAIVQDEQLTVSWQGDGGQELQMIFGVEDGTPVIRELAISKEGDTWDILGSNLKPEYRVVSGVRRVTQQQTAPLKDLGISLTEQKLDEIKWDAFWDAPLYVENEPPRNHTSSIPAAEPFANHPGMPRNPEEITRATATFNVKSCSVKTDGVRLQITFPGVEAGIFSGYLQYDIHKGTNLVKQTLVAKTDHKSAAFKYDAGITGSKLDKSRMVWRSLEGSWQNHAINPLEDSAARIVKGNNRLIAAELPNGAISAFPPPHSFYWARESEQNLGYGWYRSDDADHFSFGIRQAELEEDPEFYHNFALYNARPGLWQRMPMFLYISSGDGEEVINASLRFTNGDRYKPLAGYKVMGHHYHVGLAKRSQSEGDHSGLNDIETMKSIGVNIYGVIDGVRGAGRHDKGELFLEDLAKYYESASSLSDSNFLVMPNDENSTGGRPPFMGGHYDILISKPLYWRPAREPGEPLFRQHPKYGKVYNLGTPEDMMKMTEYENVIISMPHPRAKKSTGYPEAIRDDSHFKHPNYFGLGYRWGMGIDASEIRLGEYRFLKMWDEVNNWMAQHGLPPKYALAISETRSDIGERGKPIEDDTYGMSPVNYLKIDKVPKLENMSSIIDALKDGDYFVTTGEVLIPEFEVQGNGEDKILMAEVHWTFPLEFIELVWGNGEITERQLIKTTDLSAFGKKRFEIPFSTKGKKWIRFAAWDMASNGALVQPVSLMAPEK